MLKQDYGNCCCDVVIGGLVVIEAVFHGGGGGGGQEGNSLTLEAMGEVRIQPMNVTRTAGASSGGTLWVTEAARPYRLILTFVNRCNKDPLRLFRERCQISITLTELSRCDDMTHKFLGCVIVGDVEMNLATGEITGMEVVAQTYVPPDLAQVAQGLQQEHDARVGAQG
jgi:hypothetical protein